jgi:hypothetical protein
VLALELRSGYEAPSCWPGESARRASAATLICPTAGFPALTGLTLADALDAVSIGLLRSLGLQDDAVFAVLARLRQPVISDWLRRRPGTPFDR